MPSLSSYPHLLFNWLTLTCFYFPHHCKDLVPYDRLEHLTRKYLLIKSYKSLLQFSKIKIGHVQALANNKTESGIFLYKLSFS